MGSTDVPFRLGNHVLPPDESDLAQQICDEANITAMALYCKWEAWALSHNKTSSTPTLSDLQALQAHIRSKASKSTPIPKPALTSLYHPAYPTPTRVNVDDFFTYLDADQVPLPHDDPPPSPTLPTQPTPTPPTNPSSPNNQNHKDTLILSVASIGKPRQISLQNDDQPDQIYAAREAPGRIEAIINSGISPQTSQSRSLLSIRTVRPSPTQPRYMNDELRAKIESVRARLQALSTRILARLAHLRPPDQQLPTLSPESFFVPSPDVVLAVGRIRVELDDSEGVAAGRINASSVLLESEDGNIVKLNLARMAERKTPLFLHPGMIVVVEGVNTNGRCIHVHAVYDNAMAIPTAPAKNRRILQLDDQADEEELPNPAQPTDDEPYATLMFAAGPFTTSANLNYEPLDDLLSAVATARPDAVFLTGPFVDANHAQISAATPVPFQQVFDTRVLARLRSAIAAMASAENPAPHFILVPSLDDVHHDFVCPQPPFRSAEDPLPPEVGITMLGNPGVVELSAKNGRFAAMVGISSLPALQDISGDCLCMNKGDRFSAIASHMLRQCTFYPTFPPSPAVPLDSTLFDHMVIPDLERAPTIDVLVCPSKLKAFVKNVDGGAVAVNPGLLCRGSSGGTYAELRVPLHSVDKVRPLNANADRLRASIVRL